MPLLPLSSVYCSLKHSLSWLLENLYLYSNLYLLNSLCLSMFLFLNSYSKLNFFLSYYLSIYIYIPHARSIYRLSISLASLFLYFFLSFSHYFLPSFTYLPILAFQFLFSFLTFSFLPSYSYITYFLYLTLRPMRSSRQWYRRCVGD